MPLFLAYDGSLNGGWIANYALHMAAGRADRRLAIVHVEDADISGQPLRDALARLSARAERMGVALETRIAPMRHGVVGGLLDEIPAGPETVVVCGARARAGRRGVLSGTVSEGLLREAPCHVMSIRVVQPGYLGTPRRVLLALDADGGGARDAVPFLGPMAGFVDRLSILAIMLVSHRRFRVMTDAEAARLRHKGRGDCALAETEVARGTGIDLARIEPLVRVSDDWPKQVAVEAGRHKSGLIMAPIRRRDLGGLGFAHPIEELMRIAPADVAAFRGYTG